MDNNRFGKNHHHLYNEMHKSEEGVDSEHVSPFKSTFIKTDLYYTTPIKMKCTADGDGSTVSYSVDHTQDYLVDSELRANFPSAEVLPEYRDTHQICYPHNMMNNIVKVAYFEAKKMKIQTMDTVGYDFMSQWYSDNSKSAVTQAEMGNTPELEEWNTVLPARKLAAFQPWFYTEDVSFAWPIYYGKHFSKATHHYEFRRNVFELLRMRVRDGDKVKIIVDPEEIKKYVKIKGKDQILPELWGWFAKADRENPDMNMSCNKGHKYLIRDIVACDSTQVGTYGSNLIVPLKSSSPCFAIMWAAENRKATASGCFSNYTTDKENIDSGLNPIDTVGFSISQAGIKMSGIDGQIFTRSRVGFTSNPTDAGHHAYLFSYYKMNIDPSPGVVFQDGDYLECRLYNGVDNGEYIEDDAESLFTDDMSVATKEQIVKGTDTTFKIRARLLVSKILRIFYDEPSKLYDFELK